MSEIKKIDLESANLVDERIDLLVAEMLVSGDVQPAGRAYPSGGKDGLRDLLLRGRRRRRDPREGVGNVQDLKEALDAAVLAIGAVKSHEGDVVPTAGDLGDKVCVGKIKQVNGLEPILEKGPADLRRRLEGYLPLVRPATANDGDPAVPQALTIHRSSLSAGCRTLDSHVE